MKPLIRKTWRANKTSSSSVIGIPEYLGIPAGSIVMMEQSKIDFENQVIITKLDPEMLTAALKKGPIKPDPTGAYYFENWEEYAVTKASEREIKDVLGLSLSNLLDKIFGSEEERMKENMKWDEIKGKDAITQIKEKEQAQETNEKENQEGWKKIKVTNKTTELNPDQPGQEVFKKKIFVIKNMQNEPIKPTTKSTTESTTKPTTESTTKPTTKSTTESTTKPTTESTTESTTKPTENSKEDNNVNKF